MEITSIIVTVGIVIGGLLVLGAIIYGIFAVVAWKAFKRQKEEMKREFDNFGNRRIKPLNHPYR